MSAEQSYDDLEDAPELDDDLTVVDEEDEDEDGRDIVRAKWTMDGARTLSEAAAKLEAFARELRGMEEDGWQLTDPVQDDYGFIEQADS